MMNRFVQNFLLKNQNKNICFFSTQQSVKELVGANPVRKFSLEFAEIQKQNPKSLNLALGVPMDPTCPSIVKAKHDFIEFSAQSGNNGYGDPRGIQSLRDNLAQSYRDQFKQPEDILNSSHINLIPGGTSNALCLSMERIFKDCNGEGEVIILAPFFGPYLGMVKLSRGVPVIVDTDKEFYPDLDAIEKAITKNTKAIIFNSPNNPSGKVYPEQTIRNLLNLARKHNLTVISDEIYDKFAYFEEKPFHSVMEYFGEYQDLNLISVGSPGKSYGMIGDRIGTLVSNKLEFVEDITITLGYRFASSPYLPQYAFDSIFQNQKEIQEHLEKTNALYKEKAIYLVEGLRKIGFNAQDLEGGMFAMTEVKSLVGMNGDEFSQFLLKQDVPIAVYPGSFFGESYKDYLRFTTCPTLETMEAGLKQIQIYVDQIKASQ